MDHHVVIATILVLFFVIASAMAENGAENSRAYLGSRHQISDKLTLQLLCSFSL